MVLKYPPNWQLKKLLRQTCTLRKKAFTLSDDEYEQGIESYTEYTIEHCEIQPITSEDLVWLPAGILRVGDARGWFNDLISSIICLSNFEVSTLYTYDNTKIEVEDGEAKLISPYSIANPTIYKTSGYVFQVPAFSFEVEETKPYGTEIKYILSKDNGTTWYYFSSVTGIWVVSDGTYTQSNTSSEIEDNLSDLPFSSGTFKWKAFLHSDGSNTPILKKFTMTFGLRIEVDDEIIDHQSKRYNVEQVTDYYTKDGVFLKEAYLKRKVGEEAEEDC